MDNCLYRCIMSFVDLFVFFASLNMANVFVTEPDQR